MIEFPTEKREALELALCSGNGAAVARCDRCVPKLFDLGFERGLSATELGGEDRPNARIRVIGLCPMTASHVRFCAVTRYRLPAST